MFRNTTPARPSFVVFPVKELGKTKKTTRGFHCYCSVYENPFRKELAAVVTSASSASRKASSRATGKTPEAATVWPSPNPPTFSQEAGSILDNGGRLPVSIIFDSGWGARPETFTNGEGSLPHPGTSGGTFIIPMRYLTGLTSLW